MPNFRNFYTNIKAIQVAAGKTALGDARYPLSGSFIDTKGFDRVCFLVGMADVVTPDFAVYADTSATETGNIAAVTSASKTDVATGDDNKWFSIDFAVSDLAAMDTSSLLYRYVTLSVSGTSTDYANIWCFLWRGADLAVTQPAGYFAGVIVGG